MPIYCKETAFIYGLPFQEAPEMQTYLELGHEQEQLNRIKNSMTA
jgi:hypothetical protein